MVPWFLSPVPTRSRPPAAAPPRPWPPHRRGPPRAQPPAPRRGRCGARLRRAPAKCRPLRPWFGGDRFVAAGRTQRQGEDSKEFSRQSEHHLGSLVSLAERKHVFVLWMGGCIFGQIGQDQNHPKPLHHVAGNIANLRFFCEFSWPHVALAKTKSLWLHGSLADRADFRADRKTESTTEGVARSY